MRDILKAGVRRFASGWYWALALLVLPNCMLERGGLCCAPPHLTSGDSPHSSAIMCDIEKYQGATRRCATPADLAMGIPLAQAAEALATGQTSAVGLDFSSAAQAACGAGNPQAIDFRGPFPEGTAVCINCGVIPTPHADATAVCVAKCQDLVDYGGAPYPPDRLAFCTANAHPSTNFPASGCFDNACSTGGTLDPAFVDPRRAPEPVIWTDLIGTMAVGNTLSRSAPTGAGGELNAGAVSTQWIAHGDAYVEFEAGNSPGFTRIAGLSQVSGACPFPCTDSDPGILNLPFAISLNFAGKVYIVENGVVPSDPAHTEPDGSWGSYAVGERFRVNLKDNNDGTAAVTYTRVAGTCVPGNPCVETPIYTHVGPAAVYPLRVDTSFREQNGSLANVNIVRIK